MCSELTPRACILDTRIPQLMQPCVNVYMFILTNIYFTNLYSTFALYYWKMFFFSSWCCKFRSFPSVEALSYLSFVIVLTSSITDKIRKVFFDSLKCDNFHFPITFSYLSSFEVSYPSTFQIPPLTTGLPKWQKFLNNPCRMQLSPTVATSASTHAQELLTSTSFDILVKLEFGFNWQGARNT